MRRLKETSAVAIVSRKNEQIARAGCLSLGGETERLLLGEFNREIYEAPLRQSGLSANDRTNRSALKRGGAGT
ncbi:MAG: hypothetical protein LBI57_07295 [Helicobacteraceae bacterium]|jgi:hypothetical protein|nr:hypothetical protein [Helicobacteraceae bacterium]